ncbi:hypothetical protein BDM02DRAFT_3183021 [Thelephora ganbajun]|uniref:Uncharacterized protein n=1 Tax=Thelephora ganbajun TaxID=370292 RepID=A0ACB6ZVB3_THEGA|nr:hypothetical protein BDM02DRAFT_3183021 [Thelephora ganbajun]
MSARQPFRPTSRPDPQLSSSQSDPKVFHSQRIDSDLGNAANKSFNLSGLFNPKKRDQSLPARKSKSHDDHQVPPQNISNSSWSASSHTSKLDLSRAPSPPPSTISGLGNISTYQSSGMSSAQVEDIPSSPVADNGNITSSFFAQEANSQHLLPMINEVDEETELVNGPAASEASLFFTGRYVDGFGSRKRAQRTDEDANNMESVSAKKFKTEQVISQSLPSMRRFVTIVSKQAPGPTVRSRQSSHPHAAPPEQLRTKQHKLDTLLGLDSDAYIGENLRKYEDLKDKWANSSMEEWNAGAQDIAKKFSGILDMAKDHMMQKMSLYADIQAKIDEHKNVLEDRSKELSEAKRDLVKRSGSAIGKED